MDRPVAEVDSVGAEIQAWGICGNSEDKCSMRDQGWIVVPTRGRELLKHEHGQGLDEKGT